MKIRKVAVIGLGYVGLPTLVALSKTNLYSAVGFDIDKKKINLLKKSASPIEDIDVKRYLEKFSLNVSGDEDVIKNSDVFIICVPTPVFDDYTPNYSYIESAAKTIAKYLKNGCQVILESTVNPGTCREIIAPLLSLNSKLQLGKDYNLAHCPERINPGDSKWNIYNINRNIGSFGKKFNKKIADFYRSFITNATINEVSSLEIAEASKIIENTFRDINIAFVNELAKSFETLNINLIETLKAASNKPFGFMTHWPGCGVGGHCIPVDPYYLIERASKSGFDHTFLKLARKINNSMPEYTVQKLIIGLNNLKLAVKGTKITLLGLSYKPNVGDIRESPAITIKKMLLSLGAILKTYDPYVPGDHKDLKSALKDSVAVVIATSHNEFKANLPKLLSKSKIKLVVDGRNCLDKKVTESYNIIYKGIGQ